MKYEKGAFMVVPTITRGWPPPKQTVYMWLCYYQNQEGMAWPSMTRLAEDTGMSYGSVVAWVSGLVKDGYVKKTSRFSESGKQQSNLYELFIEPRRRGAKPGGGEGAKSEPPTLQNLDPNYIQKEPYSERTIRNQAQEESCETGDKFYAIRDDRGHVVEMHPVIPEPAPTTSPSSAAPPSSKKLVPFSQGHETVSKLPKRPITPKTTPDDDRMVALLFKLMRENNPNCKQPNFTKWADEFGLIRRIDKREQRQIEAMIRWSQQNEFWKQNILSPAKLRRHWDKMYMRMSHEFQKQISNTVQDFSFNPDELFS